MNPNQKIQNKVLSNYHINQEIFPMIGGISNGIFMGCRYLKGIYLPDNIIALGIGVFTDYISLKEIWLPQNLKRIPNDTFYNCLSLSDIQLRESIKCIGENAFRNCVRLRYVIVLKSVSKISPYAFAGCTNLENVVISANVPFDSTAFVKCPKVQICDLPHHLERKQMIEEHLRFTSSDVSRSFLQMVQYFPSLVFPLSMEKDVLPFLCEQSQHPLVHMANAIDFHRQVRCGSLWRKL